MQIKILPGLNFLNGVRKRRLLAKETSIASCEVLDEKHRIAVQGIYADLHKTNVVIIIKAGGAIVLRKQICCLPSLFVKNKPGKLVSSLVWL